MTFWSRHLSILLTLSSTTHVKRQANNVTVPADCQRYCSKSKYAFCRPRNHRVALAETQVLILRRRRCSCSCSVLWESLFYPCAANSSFQLALADCTNCLQSYSNAVNVTEISDLDQLIAVCNGTSEELISAQAVLSSVTSQEAALSQSSVSLASVLASENSFLGITSSSSTLKTSKVLSSGWLEKAILMQT